MAHAHENISIHPFIHSLYLFMYLFIRSFIYSFILNRISVYFCTDPLYISTLYRSDM